MIKVYVSDRFTFDGLDIFIVRHTEYKKLILHTHDDGRNTWDEHDESIEAQPTFRLTHDAAQALLQALSAHYGGVDDTRTLRRDYDAERGRGDKLTDVVAGIATSLASRS